MTMKRSVRSLRTKARQLLKLYSLWHETHQEGYERKYLSLLGEILSADPAFNPRREFQIAF